MFSFSGRAAALSVSAALLSLTIGSAFAANPSSASSALSLSLTNPSSAASSASVKTPSISSPAPFFRLGDVNMDGRITSADTTLVGRYAAGKIQFTAQQKSLADVDVDGQITLRDAQIISMFAGGVLRSLPWQGRFGDVNFDGLVTSADTTLVAREATGPSSFSALQLYYGDVDQDGKITQMDAQIISAYAGGMITFLPWKPLLGDVSLNGSLSSTDITLIRRYLGGLYPFTDLQKKLGDVNLDGRVDNLDVEILREYLGGGAVKSLPSNLKYGDVTLNGTLSGLDVAWVMQYILGTLTFTDLQKTLADVNLDGHITDCDTTMIQKAVVGLLTLPTSSHCEEAATMNIVQRATTSSDFVVKNQKNITLLRMEASAKGVDELLTALTFQAKQGNILNAGNYTLWVDTDGNGNVDTILQTGVSAQNSRVVFDKMKNGGYVVSLAQKVTFEIHADIAVSISSSTLQLAFATADSNYVAAERLVDGVSLTPISTNGVCPKAACQILVQTNDATVYTIAPSGDLYVSQSSTPVRSHQLLGGTLGDAMLRVQLLAQYEDVDVTRLVFTPTGPNTNRFATDVASVDLYRVGESTPFASATRSCGNDTAVPAYSFCAIMQLRQLVVPRGMSVDVLARPRVNNDEAGTVSGDSFALTMQTASGFQPVSAEGDLSRVTLQPNNGNTTSGEGEVFVGTISAGPNHDIVGNLNQVVLSKISSITNADPNANGAAIPTGTSRAIAQFKFTAASNDNSKNGVNMWAADGLLFDVNATNVGLDRSSFRLYNKMNSSVRATCSVTDAAGNPLSGSASLVTGQLLVQCVNLNTSDVNTKLDPGTDTTFVLQADILTGQISPMSSSTLQVSLTNFTDINATTLSAAGSHVKWLDTEPNSPAAPSFLWIDYPETTVKGTAYAN